MKNRSLPCCRIRWRRRPHRRGAVYLAVLGTSMLVTLIGISAMLTNRAIHRAGETTHRATEARYIAHGVMELAMLQINNDAGWRGSHTHDQWSPAHELGRGEGRYRLLATTGSNLQSPADGHVYLEAEGRVGDAVRRMRVALQPMHHQPGTNLARNPDMAEGTRFWRAGLPNDTLEYTLAEPYRGAGSLRVRNFSGGGSQPSIRQEVSHWLESGRSYRIRLAVHLLNSDRHINARFIVNGNVVATQTFSSSGANNWAQHTAVLTPSWTGEIESAYLDIRAHQHTDFLIDDVVIYPLDAEHQMLPVPGTWRQTLQ
ncbi:hypothetical protein ACERK3_03520 [Phycisphaerales bacterium AB-hyl4]|uniref:CBM-cenC domain-containing protein n=1 Tax=Natronomicrosphaera hydrolytica TaxID=3242702 RepID=A0ABV4U181_9BACT